MENAGYEIIKLETTSRPGEQERGFAIAKAVNPKTPAQWVTWRYVVDNGYDFCTGNYFTEERAAYADLYRRLSEHYQDFNGWRF